MPLNINAGTLITARPFLPPTMYTGTSELSRARGLMTTHTMGTARAAWTRRIAAIAAVAVLLLATPAQAQLIRVGNVALANNIAISVCVDASGEFSYWGTNTNPAAVAKVGSGAPTSAPNLTATRTLPSPPTSTSNLRSCECGLGARSSP